MSITMMAQLKAEVSQFPRLTNMQCFRLLLAPWTLQKKEIVKTLCTEMITLYKIIVHLASCIMGEHVDSMTRRF